MNNIEVIPIKTRLIMPPKDNIYDVLDNLELKEKDVILITSKILAIHQGLCLPVEEIDNKDELIKQESDFYLPREKCPHNYAVLTIKNNTLIPSAGIDESNANNHCILWPKDPEQEAKKICNYLKEKFSLKKLAVIITDSHTTPLRKGTQGVSIGFFGLEPTKDYVGKEDLFGRKLKVSRSNIVDSLAVMGVLAMGEGNEQTPMAIIREVNFVKFTNKETYEDLLIDVEEDIYYPLLLEFYENKKL